MPSPLHVLITDCVIIDSVSVYGNGAVNDIIRLLATIGLRLTGVSTLD